MLNAQLLVKASIKGKEIHLIFRNGGSTRFSRTLGSCMLADVKMLSHVWFRKINNLPKNKPQYFELVLFGCGVSHGEC